MALPERKFEILHITDVHGWIDGHRHIEGLDADFGDLVSLIEWKRALADFVDRYFSDMMEGTGISDASAVHGQFVIPSFPLDLDALTIGNHDLATNAGVDNLLEKSKARWGDRYITTNVFHKVHGRMGSPYLVTTVGDTKILYLGVMYNFDHQADSVEVQFVEDMVEDTAFLEAMEQEVDIVISLCHISPTLQPELDNLQKAIRSHKPDVPLVLLTGHDHVLYSSLPDAQTVKFDSACYFLNIGVLHFTLSPSNEMNIESRMWYPTTRETLAKMAGRDLSNFLTPSGEELKIQLAKWNTELGLDTVEGCSNYTYQNNKPPSSEFSLYNLLYYHVVPEILFPNMIPGVTKNDLWFVSNNAFMRTSIFQGEIVFDDLLSIDPFNDTFHVVDPIPGTIIPELKKALVALGTLGERGTILGGDERGSIAFEARPPVDSRLPKYMWQDIKISPKKSYALVCVEYDAQVIVKVLAKLDPSIQVTSQKFSHITSVPSLKAYVNGRMSHC